MTLADLTRTDVLTAAPNTTVGDVAAAMRAADGDHPSTTSDLVVVLDEQRPLGVLTAADLGRAFVEGESLADRPAAELLGGDPVTVRASADREMLLSTFEDEGVERILVVDDGGDFVGVVSLRDVLVRYGRELGMVFDLLERR